MKRFFLLLALITGVTTVFALKTPAGEVDVSSGRIIVNGKRLTVVPKYQGYKGRPLVLANEIYFETSGKNPGFFISLYPDESPAVQGGLAQQIIITDVTGDELRQSNVLDTGAEFIWGDNNYVIFEGKTMYFGIYAPKRMQFVYQDGKLEIYNGPWKGPAKPQTYIEPLGTDPCGNVNGVEECREEVARNKAKSKAKSSK